MPASEAVETPPEVPGYRVLERLGAGGFGEVFRARHAVIDREVAIKIVHARHCADPTAVARFVAEARAANKIAHPNIVEIHDLGTLADGRPYCVMELLHGVTLRHLLDERGALPLAEALPILRGVAEAVDAAHAAGIAHRDLKPDNVFVLPGGAIKLIDFGLAKLTTEDASITQTGQVFGTPLYMSPEQCRGRGVTLATDAYSFGALAYHVLVGAPPFTGEPLDLAVQHINDAPPAPSSRNTALPAQVDRPLLALLAKDPASRPEAMALVVDELAGTRAAPSRRSRRAAFAAAAAASVAVLAWIAPWPSAAPHAPEHWTTHTMRVDLDGLTTNPSLTRDRSALLYGDESGWWRLDLASGHSERIPLAGSNMHDVSNVEDLGDGRLLVGTASPLATDIFDPRDHHREHVVDAGWPSLSPDGHVVAGWDPDRWLVVHDLVTGQTRKLFHVVDSGPETPPRWSPDGQHLLWGRGRFTPGNAHGPYHTFVTTVRDGTTTPLVGIADVPYRHSTTDDYYSPIAFLRDGRIAYCTAGPAEVRARALWGGSEITLATLDPSVSECMLAARGDTLAITLGHSQTTVSWIDLRRAAGQPVIPRQIAGPVHLEPAALDEQRLYSYLPADSTAPTAPRTIRVIELASGASSDLAACPDETFMVHRGGELLRGVRKRERDAGRVRLMTADCQTVDEWHLQPSPVEIGPADCGSTWCTIASARDGEVVAWRLEHDRPPRELARVRFAGAVPVPVAAVSPDGLTVALALSETIHPAIYVLPADGGTARHVPLDAEVVDGIAWDASGRLLVSGQGIDGAPFALVSIAQDDTHDSLWSSKSTNLTALYVDPARTHLAGRSANWQQEFLVVEPAITDGDRPR